MMTNEYVDNYLDLMDRLTARYHSRYWFSTYTASKSREVTKLFEDLHCLVNKKSTLSKRGNPGFSAVRFFAITAVRIIRLWVRMSAARVYFSGATNKLDKKHGLTLIRSWFYPASVDKNGSYTDQFFGGLPGYLAEKGKNVVIIGTVFSNSYIGTIKKLAYAKGPVVIPQEYFISYLDPIRALADIFKNRTRIEDKIDFMGYDVTSLVKFYVNRDFSDTVFEQMISSYLIKNLSAKFNINEYIYTFENNPWEKVTLDAFKAYSPGTKTIGYKHTVIAPGRFEMRLGANERKFTPLPDRIATNGKAVKDMLIKYGNFPPEKVFEGCALRFKVETQIKNRQSRPPAAKTVLIAPTAFFTSAEVVNVAYKAFAGRPDYKVVIRPHPGLSLDKMRRYLAVDPDDMPKNFTVSRNIKVEDDISASDYLLYDQSSLSLNALIMGVPSICINTDPIISMDPLFDCKYMKKEAADADGVFLAIKYFSGLNDDDFKKEQAAAKEYACNYLSPVSNEGLKAFLF